jgi:hypothetical protein
MNLSSLRTVFFALVSIEKPRLKGGNLSNLGVLLAALFLVLYPVSTVAQTGTSKPASPVVSIRPLSANDVSILFPVPRSKDDLAGLIPLSDLMARGSDGARLRIWSDADFSSFISISNTVPGNVVAGTQRSISLTADARQASAWFIAGIRIDHAAPGASPDVIKALGQQPQIRLIAQPLSIDAGGRVRVHDIAAHLIYSFVTPTELLPAMDGCLKRSEPDQQAFAQVIKHFADLRTQLASGNFGGVSVKTSGLPLNVHPGFSGASRIPFRNALKTALEDHLAPDKLRAMAVMGLNNGGPEPWIFLSMARLPKGTVLPGIGTLPADMFVPAPNPVLNGRDMAQMLSFLDTTQQVQPKPQNNNLNPIDCHHSTFQNPIPISDRKGVSTADIIDGNPTPAAIAGITGTIANPVKSHFFNTDCVSCHTETQLTFGNSRSPTSLVVKPVKGIATAVLPDHNWNVRNFGWFPNFFNNNAARPTVTRRTALETAEVVVGVNAIITELNKVVEKPNGAGTSKP